MVFVRRMLITHFYKKICMNKTMNTTPNIKLLENKNSIDNGREMKNIENI